MTWSEGRIWMLALGAVGGALMRGRDGGHGNAAALRALWSLRVCRPQRGRVEKERRPAAPALVI